MRVWSVPCKSTAGRYGKAAHLWGLGWCVVFRSPHHNNEKRGSRPLRSSSVHTPPRVQACFFPSLHSAHTPTPQTFMRKAFGHKIACTARPQGHCATRASCKLKPCHCLHTQVKGPVGHFTYEGKGKYVNGKTKGVAKHFSMLAGGTGITPILQVCGAPPSCTQAWSLHVSVPVA